jgi:AAA domain, putative AbiEii toxin, Type IV TA system/AAA ATPase domain
MHLTYHKSSDILPASASTGQPLGVVSRPDEYRMIESFEIENFRCFDTLKLNDLKRVNIITGENASGKTALLEALFAAARANAEGLIYLNQLRGIGTPPSFPGLPMVISAQQFAALWDHWFYFSKRNGSSQSANRLALRYTDSDCNDYSVELSLGESEGIIPQIAGPVSAGIIPLIISRTATKPQQQQVKSSSVVSLGLQGQVQNSTPLPTLGPSTFIFTAALNYAEIDNVTWFSQLKEKGETGDILNFLNTNFPFIGNLEVLAPAATPGIYAALSSGGMRRLQLISSGVYKVISLLLACARSEKGIILIDEIENGIFYDKYTLMWDVLNKFSENYKCQLFVTSHSAECLQKLVPVMEDDVENFSLLRTERENGKCVVRHISGASMKAALKRGGEIRGASVSSSDQNH